MGAAWRLHEKGDQDWLLLEQALVPGGAAASHIDKHGFVWDMGGHVIHSHFDYFDAVMAQCVRDWSYPRRSGWVYLDGRFVPTPLQQNLASLPDAMANRVLDDVADTDRDVAPASLDEWFRDTFGNTLTDAFFEPFNAKMWGYPGKYLEHTWTSLRNGSEARNIPPLAAGSQVHDTSPFPYPRHGSGSMWTDIARHLPSERIRYGATVARINHYEHLVEVDETGEIIHYDNLISTLPLDILLTHLGYSELAGQLLHSSVHVLGFGYEGTPPPELAGKSWIYEPDPDVPFHRVTVLSNYSELIAGEGRWSLLLEAGTSPVRPIDQGNLVRDAREALQRWGVHDAPVSVWQRYLPRGYPVPFLGRDEMLLPTMSALESNDVYSRGRFGGWRYESCNQDYSFMQGVEAVDRALDGVVESTYWPTRFSA